MLISAGMITKNSEEYIKYSIKSFIDYVGELIIVDDGSTDNTLDIVSEFPKVKIIQGKYNGDKIKQRNEYISKAKGDWLITPDSDEVFYDHDMKWLQNYLANEADECLFVGVHHRTFWMDFCHVITGQVYDGVKHRIFRNLPGIKHKDLHYAVNMNDDEILHTHAVVHNKRNRIKDFKIAHYSYTGSSNKIREKIRYYMKRDNPNCKTDKLVDEYVERHPYFSGNFDQPRYGKNGLDCCGTHAGIKDELKFFNGQHPAVMEKHPRFEYLYDYVLGMNRYMETHWRFHNHLHHERHQNRLKLTAKYCQGSTVDIGCANGDTTDIIKRLNPKNEIVGVEPTDWGYSTAKKNHKDIEFYQALGENTPFKDKSFDTVLLSEIIEHTYSPRVLLEEANRLSRKRIIVTTPSEPHPDPDHKRFYPVHKMNKILSQYGDVTITGLKRDGGMATTNKEIYFMIAMVDKNG